MASLDNGGSSCRLLLYVRPYSKEILFEDSGPAGKDHPLADLPVEGVDTDFLYVLPWNSAEIYPRNPCGVHRFFLFRPGADVDICRLSLYSCVFVNL